MKKGIFITFEGCEGCGKSTHSLLVYEHLKKQGFEVVLTREPGGTMTAEAIRRVLLDPANKVSPLAELFLYEAARAQHTEDTIIPALKAGNIILCDRFTDATIAYQGYGRGLDFDVIKKLNTIASSGIKPDLTIYLDISIEKGLKKARTLNKDSFQDGDRIERENIEFHKKVKEGYLELAAKETERIKIVSSSDTIEVTHKKIINIIDKMIKCEYADKIA